MDPRRVLVVFATRLGQTRRIAERLAIRVREHGLFASCFDVRDLAPDLDLDSYQGVIVGASLDPGHHQLSVARFLRQHREALRELHTAFFSVTLAVAGNPAMREGVHRGAGRFLQAAMFSPELHEDLAGALRFSRAGWLLRSFMRHEERLLGVDNPWDQDLELTDWDEVDRFAERFLEHMDAAPEAHPDETSGPPMP